MRLNTSITEQEDLFEHPELIPENVQLLLDKFEEVDINEGVSYEDCAKLVSELEKIGYTCEYGLDACLYDLRKI